ncbi:YcxB-like protein [Saccharicrinis carchari]|uniref:YcxB-like protein n=1 Tax=Saccharicrinis carchari TaxID=1168039 RepID=A0A521DEM7_SACCC|nr:YcxB family protein [Saccharicrinis carchari]SMO70149.1 YcxB-like protein [Saccharicrinis carchari]
MEIKTEITRNDFLEFNKHVMYGKRLRRHFLIATVFVIIWIVLLNIGEPFDLLKVISEAVIFFAIWSLLIFIFNQISLYRIKRIPDSSGSILGEKTYLMEENGFKEISESSETLTSWEGLKEIQESKDYYFLFVDKIAAYIIPKRSFRNKMQEQDFIDAVNRKMGRY